MNLEHKVEERLNNIELKDKYKGIVYKYLDALKEYDGTSKDSVYAHSARVGLLAYDAAEYLSLDKKAMFLSGLLHDIGKMMIDRNILHKRHFTEQDYKKIMPHPENGHDMLTGTMEFTAQVIVRHHRHQKYPYPEILPKPKAPFSEETINKIDKYGLILAMADFYDSFFRNDQKYFDRFNKFNTSKGSIKKAYFNHRGELNGVFYELVDMGIFSKKYRKI